MDKEVMESIKNSLKVIAEVNKANEQNKVTTLDFIKEQAIVFILGIVVGYMLCQLGIK